MIQDVRNRMAAIQSRFGQGPPPAAQAPTTTASALSGDVANTGMAQFQQLLNAASAQQSMGFAPANNELWRTLGGGVVQSGLPTGAYPTSAYPTSAYPTSGVASPGLPEGAAAYQQAFEAAEARYGVPADLLAAVAWTESNFNPSAVSHAGAVGLMQIMPGTAGDLGVDPRDPWQSIDGAARYLRDQIDRFGDLRLAVAAYNAGPGAVQNHGGVPPYAETNEYVNRVTARYESLRATP